jgi:hypothetical protein
LFGLDFDKVVAVADCSEVIFDYSFGFVDKNYLDFDDFLFYHKVNFQTNSQSF